MEAPWRSLRIPAFWFTLLGLFTGGAFWRFYSARWSRRHARTLLDAGVPACLVIRASIRTRVLGIATGSMILLALFLLAVELGWESTRSGMLWPFPEEAFWGFCWVSLAMLAVTLGSLLRELSRHVFDGAPPGVSSLTPTPWLLRDEGGDRIWWTAALNAAIALGLLPLLIFPPLAASTVNGYLNARPRVESLRGHNWQAVIARRIGIECPKCRTHLKGLTAEMVGDTGVCPACREEFTITAEMLGLRRE